MKEMTFQQKFGVFALVAAVLLLIVNLVVAGTTVLGISSPLLLGITGIIMTVSYTHLTLPTSDLV